MKKWTVVGCYQDNGQIWVHWVSASGWEAAIERATKQILKCNENMDTGNIMICSVFKGHQRDYSEHDTLCTAKEK